MPSIAILDDRLAVAQSLAHALELLQGFTCVGVSTSIGQFRKLAEKHRFDVALVSLSESAFVHLNLLRDEPFKSGEVRVLFSAANINAAVATKIRSLGGPGIVFHSASIGELADALRRVAAGNYVFDEWVIPGASSIVRSESEPAS